MMSELAIHEEGEERSREREGESEVGGKGRREHGGTKPKDKYKAGREEKA